MDGSNDGAEQLAGVEAARACVCFNFRKAARAVTQLYDAALEPSGHAGNSEQAFFKLCPR